MRYLDNLQIERLVKLGLVGNTIIRYNAIHESC